MEVYSVPMELHIAAESPAAALAVAHFAPKHLHAEDGSGPHSLYVATDDARDVEEAS